MAVALHRCGVLEGGREGGEGEAENRTASLMKGGNAHASADYLHSPLLTQHHHDMSCPSLPFACCLAVYIYYARCVLRSVRRVW